MYRLLWWTNMQWNNKQIEMLCLGSRAGVTKLILNLICPIITNRVAEPGWLKARSSTRFNATIKTDASRSLHSARGLLNENGPRTDGPREQTTPLKDSPPLKRTRSPTVRDGSIHGWFTVHDGSVHRRFHIFLDFHSSIFRQCITYLFH